MAALGKPLWFNFDYYEDTKVVSTSARFLLEYLLDEGSS